MSSAVNIDRQMLRVALSEIDVVRRRLPETALASLAQEVVKQVAKNFAQNALDERLPVDIADLCAALLADDPLLAAAMIEQAELDGVSYDDLCTNLLGRAAHHLGEMWEDDAISFFQVTLAAGRIYAILRVLRMHNPAPLPDLRKSAVFASVPGEDHTLGITMATDLARDRGWDIELFTGLDYDDLLDKLVQRKPALIGLSASGRRALPILTQLIVALRLSNPAARILVCGQIASGNHTLVGVTGADAAATDFESALAHMHDLLNIPRGRIS